MGNGGGGSPQHLPAEGELGVRLLVHEMEIVPFGGQKVDAAALQIGLLELVPRLEGHVENLAGQDVLPLHPDEGGCAAGRRRVDGVVHDHVRLPFDQDRQAPLEVPRRDHRFSGSKIRKYWYVRRVFSSASAQPACFISSTTNSRASLCSTGGRPAAVSCGNRSRPRGLPASGR